MFRTLKFRKRFALLLLVLVIIGVSIGGEALANRGHRTVENELTSKAVVMLSMMNAVRDYTSDQVNPALADQLDTKFFPQTIPGYSAIEVFENLRKNPDYREFFYKEATLNPSSLRDKADAFETQLVEQFRQKSDLKELRGFRSTPRGNFFYLAHPIEVSQPSCLKCHSTPDLAPKTMIEHYGTVNGFGWKLHEIIGAQIIYIPDKT